MDTKIHLLSPFLRKGIPNLSHKDSLEYIRVCVEEVFGFGSLPVELIDTHKINSEQLAKKNNWTLLIGQFNHGFIREGGTNLVFGERPDKKTMRIMVKEAKAAKKKKNVI